MEEDAITTLQQSLDKFLLLRGLFYNLAIWVLMVALDRFELEPEVKNNMVAILGKLTIDNIRTLIQTVRGFIATKMFLTTEAVTSNLVSTLNAFFRQPFPEQIASWDYTTIPTTLLSGIPFSDTNVQRLSHRVATELREYLKVREIPKFKDAGLEVLMETIQQYMTIYSYPVSFPKEVFEQQTLPDKFMTLAQMFEQELLTSQYAITAAFYDFIVGQPLLLTPAVSTESIQFSMLTPEIQKTLQNAKSDLDKTFKVVTNTNRGLKSEQMFERTRRLKNSCEKIARILADTNVHTYAFTYPDLKNLLPKAQQIYSENCEAVKAYIANKEKERKLPIVPPQQLPPSNVPLAQLAPASAPAFGSASAPAVPQDPFTPGTTGNETLKTGSSSTSDDNNWRRSSFDL